LWERDFRQGWHVHLMMNYAARRHGAISMAHRRSMAKSAKPLFDRDCGAAGLLTMIEDRLLTWRPETTVNE
jgi:hypothetical protein